MTNPENDFNANLKKESIPIAQISQEDYILDINIPIAQMLKNEYILNKLMNIHYTNDSHIVFSYLQYNYDINKNLFIETLTKHLLLNTYQISLNTTKNELNILKNHNIDENKIIIDTIKSEFLKFVYNQFKNKAFNLAEKTYKKSFTLWDKIKFWLYKIFNITYKKVIKVKNINELISIIFLKTNSIFKNTRINNKCFIICNPKAATYIRNHPGLIIESNIIHEKLNSLNYILSYVGHMQGIDVLEDLHLDNNNPMIFIGQKPDTNMQGLHYFYKNLESNTFQKFENDNDIKFTLKIRSILEDIGKNPEYNFDMFYYKMP